MTFVVFTILVASIIGTSRVEVSVCIVYLYRLVLFLIDHNQGL